MSAVLLPLRNDIPFFEVRVSLSAREYVLRFNWNERDSAWYMSLYDARLVAIKEGMKVVAGAVLLRTLVYSTTRPPGDFVVIDTTGKDQDPGFADLGSRVVITYDDTFPVVV